MVEEDDEAMAEALEAFRKVGDVSAASICRPVPTRQEKSPTPNALQGADIGSNGEEVTGTEDQGQERNAVRVNDSIDYGGWQDHHQSCAGFLHMVSRLFSGSYSVSLPILVCFFACLLLVWLFDSSAVVSLFLCMFSCLSRAAHFLSLHLECVFSSVVCCFSYHCGI